MDFNIILDHWRNVCAQWILVPLRNAWGFIYDILHIKYVGGYMVFLTSLQSIMPIVLLISLGYFLKGRGMFNDTFSSNLSRLIMSVILPVGVFMSVLHNVQTSDLWDLRYGLLVVMMTYVVSYIIAFIMMKIVHVPRGRRGIFYQYGS